MDAVAFQAKLGAWWRDRKVMVPNVYLPDASLPTGRRYLHVTVQVFGRDGGQLLVRKHNQTKFLPVAGYIEACDFDLCQTTLTKVPVPVVTTTGFFFRTVARRAALREIAEETGIALSPAEITEFSFNRAGTRGNTLEISVSLYVNRIWSPRELRNIVTDEICQVLYQRK